MSKELRDQVGEEKAKIKISEDLSYCFWQILFHNVAWLGGAIFPIHLRRTLPTVTDLWLF
jgi:hypothetical protein